MKPIYFSLGTTSENKIKYLKRVLEEKKIQHKIFPVEATSDISDQPLSKKETIIGAINRAKNSLKQVPKAGLGIGMEGGLEKIDDLHHLICVAVKINKKGETKIGVSEKIAIPKIISEAVDQGENFGQLIREYQKENPDFLQIQELISREKSFKEALQRII